MGRRARFRGVKRTNKRLENDILERSKNLWENPSILRPKCAGNCRKCAFDKTFKKIDKLEKYKNSSEALIKYAGKGSDDIFKAYAATISLYAAGSVPYMATAKLAGEDVLFAQRGAVGNDKLIGCQHYNDPKIRLFLYNAFAKKKGLLLYSFDDELVCSNYPNMPEDYIYDTFWESPYEFPNDELECAHPKEAALVIHIKSAKRRIRICKNCAKDVSTMQYLISRMIAEKPLDDFEVSIEHNYHSKDGSSSERIEGDLLKNYAYGKLTDVQLIKQVLKERLGALKDSAESTFVIGDRNFGSDSAAFIATLKGTQDEIDALTKYLAQYKDSIVVQTERASEALASIWETSYREILECFTSAETAEKMGDVGKKNLQAVLSDARRIERSKDVVKTLPEFKHMGDVTKTADTYAKAMKVGGTDLLMEEISKVPPRNYHARALAKGFALAYIENPDTVKSTAEEADLAQFLVPFIRDLVDSTGDEYRHKMSTLLTATGCGETV
ncbi:MAG: hypothetical protein IKC93_07140 [Candidatus Methanomethylophilaceae archaeon]|nr:hypothetical protein [Candidatus Methanomethylophilaceae archaeon]